jgi:RNA polymerase sigma factor (sigma-70 family)
MPHHLHVVADEELEMLVRAHEAALLRLAYLLCRDSARAEDLVQDAFLRVLGRWRSAGVPDQPFAYARKVVINEYLAWRRLRSASGQVGPVGDAEAFDHVEQLADRELPMSRSPRSWGAGKQRSAASAPGRCSSCVPTR